MSFAGSSVVGLAAQDIRELFRLRTPLGFVRLEDRFSIAVKVRGRWAEGYGWPGDALAMLGESVRAILAAPVTP
jgi:hypothetical protein